MRIAPLTPERLTPEQRRLYDAIVGGPRGPGVADPDGLLMGPFNAMLANPPIGGPLQELGSAVRYHGTLPDRARELAVLTVAAAHRAEFEWHAHVRIAAGLGVPAETLDAIRTGEAPALDDPAERLALELTRTLLDRADVDDDLYARAVAALGEAGIVEVTTLVGYYGILASQLAAFRVPLPEGAEPVFG